MQEGKNRGIVLDYARGNLSAQMALERFCQRTMAHAYLLTGAKGLGKRTLALSLACTLFCTEESKPCFHCAGCRQVLEGNNPDLLTLYSRDNQSIKIDEVRQVINTLSRHSFGTGYRVVLIEPVEKMTLQAQNCLLKSLEEPFSDVVFLLMTHELSATLGTIASRCSRVKLLPRQDEVLLDTLVRCGYDRVAVQRILPRCGGNIGLAVELLSGDRSAGETLAREILSLETESAAASLSTRMKDNKDQAQETLGALEEMVHRAMLAASGCMPGEMAEDLPAPWRRAVRAGRLEEMNRVLAEIFETRRRSAAQVNWGANADHLMMRILEENRKWLQLLE